MWTLLRSSSTHRQGVVVGSGAHALASNNALYPSQERRCCGGPRASLGVASGGGEHRLVRRGMREERPRGGDTYPEQALSGELGHRVEVRDERCRRQRVESLNYMLRDGREEVERVDCVQPEPCSNVPQRRAPGAPQVRQEQRCRSAACSRSMTTGKRTRLGRSESEPLLAP